MLGPVGMDVVARIAPRMGLDSLIKAMPAVVARHPDEQSATNRGRGDTEAS